jgi:hypothetical protein
MGTQQMLMLVITMIVVGIAITIGITMLINQGYNSNKEAMASELTTYQPLILRFWIVTKLMGGAAGDINFLTMEKLSNYIGFTGPNYSTVSANGEFRIINITGRVVTIKGLGVETKGTKHPMVTGTINVVTKSITTTLGDATGW